MKRIDAVKKILSEVKDELVVTTTGMISREAYWVGDRPGNFYMCGSMGCALSIGLGLALSTDKDVIVIDGDGSALMGLPAMVLANFLKLKNLKYIILDNGTYESTGGQPTCSSAIDFKTLFNSVDLIKVESGREPDTPRVRLNPKAILKRFMDAVREGEGKA